MSVEYLIDPEEGPQWRSLLPGAPEPFFLRRGEGERAKLFGDLFTVLLSGDVIPTHAHDATHEVFYALDGAVRVCGQDRRGEKTFRLLEPGDFGFVPAGLPHAYRVERPARMPGVVSGGGRAVGGGAGPGARRDCDVRAAPARRPPRHADARGGGTPRRNLVLLDRRAPAGRRLPPPGAVAGGHRRARPPLRRVPRLHHPGSRPTCGVFLDYATPHGHDYGRAWVRQWQERA